MRRVVLVLVLLTGAVTATAPADASEVRQVEVTAHVSSAQVLEGTSVGVHGTARGADRGTQVALQRQRPNGWTTVGTQRVSDKRTFAFSVTPMRGHQYYRVRSLPRPGQPASNSPLMSVIVQWQPTLSMSTQPTTLPHGVNGLTLEGMISDGPQTGVVDLQAMDPASGSGAWTTEQTEYVPGARAFYATVSRATGLEYRFRLRPTGLTRVAYSSVVTQSDPPYQLGVDSELDLTSLPAGPDSARVVIAGTPGQDITLVIHDPNPYGTWDASILDASGNLRVGSVQGSFPNQTNKITVAAGETVVLAAPAGEDLTLWASVPKVVPVPLDGTTVTAGGDLPGQRVDFTWTADMGQIFVVHPPVDDCLASLMAPDGSQLTPFGATADFPYGTAGCNLFRAPARDTFNYFINDSLSEPASPRDFSVANVVYTTVTVDGPPQTLHFGAAGSLGIVFLTLGDGDTLSISPDDGSVRGVGPGNPGFDAFASNAADVDFTVQQVSSLKLSGTVGGDPVPYDVSAYSSRAIDFTFQGVQGEVVQQDAANPWSVLYDPQGNRVTEQEYGPSLYVLPSTGTYRDRIWPQEKQGTIGFRDAPVVEVPLDGTPTTLTVSAGGYAVGEVKAPVGADLVANVDSVDASLGNSWRVWLQRPDTAVYGTWTQDPAIPTTEWNAPGTAEPFTLRYFDNAYFLLNDDSASGSVQVSVQPASP